MARKIIVKDLNKRLSADEKLILIKSFHRLEENEVSIGLFLFIGGFQNLIFCFLIAYQ